jgi:hypothetical protein
MEKSSLHRSYRAMKARCYNPSYHSFKHYGGRGIVVCSEWLNSEKVSIGRYIHNQSKGWLAFKEWALQNGYKEGLTLDRIDCNGNYEPANCRWASKKEQANNTRSNVLITYKNITLTIKQWSEKLGINYHTLYSRLTRSGWSVEEAFNRR